MILQKIISTFPTDLPFCYGSSEELNVLIDNVSKPCACVAQIVDSQAVKVGGQVCEQVNVIVFFLDVTEWESYSVENEEIITNCKAIADNWLSELRENVMFSIIGDIRYRRVYLQYNGYYTGIGVNLTLRENRGIVSCTPPTPPQPIPGFTRISAVQNNGIGWLEISKPVGGWDLTQLGVKLNMEIPYNVSSNSIIFGTGNTYDRYYSYINSRNIYTAVTYDNSQIDESIGEIQTNTPTDIYYNYMASGEYAINGVVKNLNRTIVTSNNNLLLLGYNSFAIQFGIYHSCEITIGSQISYSFVPVIRDNDGNVGMYDIVNNEFYDLTNKNFIAII